MTAFDGQFLLLAPLSLALIAMGIFHLLVPRWPLAARIVVSGGLLALALGASSILSDSGTYELLAQATVPTSFVLALLLRRVQSNGGHRTVRAGLGIAVAGVALLALTVVRYETASAERDEADAIDMDLLSFLPEREPDGDRQLVTDRGQAIPLLRLKMPLARGTIDAMERRAVALIGLKPGTVRTGPADDATNCHGWVFARGQSIVTNADVDTILADNDYRIVDRPVPGDLAVYRKSGAVCHTAIVRVAEPGQTVIVEGKWSWMGVFREAVDRSIYGNDYAFYRTSRPDHTVKVFDRTTTPFTGAE